VWISNGSAFTHGYSLYDAAAGYTAIFRTRRLWSRIMMRFKNQLM
jgi:hypothetical protein